MTTGRLNQVKIWEWYVNTSPRPTLPSGWPQFIPCEHCDRGNTPRVPSCAGLCSDRTAPDSSRRLQHLASSSSLKKSRELRGTRACSNKANCSTVQGAANSYCVRSVNSFLPNATARLSTLESDATLLTPRTSQDFFSFQFSLPASVPYPTARTLWSSFVPQEAFNTPDEYD